MKDHTVSFLMKISILLIALAGIIICAFWYPFSISITAAGVPSGEWVYPTAAQNIAFWTQLIFYWVISIPCFIILALGWMISGNVKKDAVFSLSTVKKLNLAFYILFIASCIFLAGNTVFTIIQWNAFAIVYYFVGIIGIVFSFAIYVLAKFVSKAQLLKEENESIL